MRPSAAPIDHLPDPIVGVDAAPGDQAALLTGDGIEPWIPDGNAPVIMPFLRSLTMTCLVSAIATVRSVGFTSAFAHLWPGSWMLSWAIAFPVTLLVLPVVRRLTALLVESP